MGDEAHQAFDTAFETAHDVYKTVTFKNPNALYNRPAPDVTFTLAFGGTMLVILISLWFVRFSHAKDMIEERGLRRTYWMSLRAAISAAIDNDDPVYTMVKIVAQSIIFLAGIQIGYHTAFLAMIIFFAVESSLDSLRTLLCVYEYDSHKDLVLVSERMRRDINDTKVTELKPTNVYEDLSRVGYVVIMVFITQFLLITFVVVDIWRSSTHTCIDGTAGCPVGGTLGSWCFYCLGIFMACVVLLGPKTNFGESEQNPVFWMQLLLYIKSGRGQVVWTDKTGEKETHKMRQDDWRVWTRFLMSFIINGIGFHILVFALPIQIAAQSSLTGVVFRAVGMLYLVDLDDSPGYKLTFLDRNHNENDDTEFINAEPDESTQLLNDNAAAIIKEAHEKLDALAAGGGTF